MAALEEEGYYLRHSGFGQRAMAAHFKKQYDAYFDLFEYAKLGYKKSIVIDRATNVLKKKKQICDRDGYDNAESMLALEAALAAAHVAMQPFIRE